MRVAPHRRAIFLIGVGVATVLVCVLFATKSVTVKLLPFDNKSELDVVLDLPEGATLEDTERTLFAVADIARQLPEVVRSQAYAGTRGAVQFQRPRASLLYARIAGAGRAAGQSRAEAPSATAPATPSRSICGAAEGADAAARHASSGRRGAARSAGARDACSPRSTDRIPRRGAPWPRK